MPGCMILIVALAAIVLLLNVLGSMLAEAAPMAPVVLPAVGGVAGLLVIARVGRPIARASTRWRARRQRRQEERHFLGQPGLAEAEPSASKAALQWLLTAEGIEPLEVAVA